LNLAMLKWFKLNPLVKRMAEPRLTVRFGQHGAKMRTQAFDYPSELYSIKNGEIRHKNDKIGFRR
jgi:hypothetical protein